MQTNVRAMDRLPGISKGAVPFSRLVAVADIHTHRGAR